MAWSGVTVCGVNWSDIVWRRVECSVVEWHCVACSGAALCGVTWSGIVWRGVEKHLEWSGTV